MFKPTGQTYAYTNGKYSQAEPEDMNAYFFSYSLFPFCPVLVREDYPPHPLFTLKIQPHILLIVTLSSALQSPLSPAPQL